MTFHYLLRPFMIKCTSIIKPWSNIRTSLTQAQIYSHLTSRLDPIGSKSCQTLLAIRYFFDLLDETVGCVTRIIVMLGFSSQSSRLSRLKTVGVWVLLMLMRNDHRSSMECLVIMFSCVSETSDIRHQTLYWFRKPWWCNANAYLVSIERLLVTTIILSLLHNTYLLVLKCMEIASLKTCCC